MSSPTVRKALATLLRDPGNGNCADCKTASHPRWASWSLGVFICIRCAGIHRSLGTHISKVKSVDLDTWQEEHLRKVVEFGNNKNANARYEAKLEQATPDPSKLNDFIRKKYELKKWAGTASMKSSPRVEASQPPVHSASHDLLGDAATQSAPPSVNTVPSRVSTPSQVDLNLATPRASSKGAPRELNGRPDLKKSILSLYSKPRNSSASVASAQSAFSLSSSVEPSSASSKPSPTPAASLEDNELFRNVWS
ncbi:LADA_0A05424g1_1 [Lachancea dasiensis]|uniref:LADA_0A05424g1_1 n=1 Tax=Lachancea dasiensis TaxID=1072105 RepID=A0A1G4INY0_9SACH|nr:LADA_0A05424g1_1 [Lachancea dasiensis]